MTNTVKVNVSDGTDSRTLDVANGTTVGQVRTQLGISAGWQAFRNGSAVSDSYAIAGVCDLEFYPAHKDKGQS